MNFDKNPKSIFFFLGGGGGGGGEGLWEEGRRGHNFEYQGSINWL